MCSQTIVFALPVNFFSLVFTFLAATISHFLNCHVVLPTKFLSFVFISRSSSFSDIHVIVDIFKKLIEKKESALLLVFFFSL